MTISTRQKKDTAREEDMYQTYREVVPRLHLLIKEAKTRAWEELLSTLDQDPWERRSRIVHSKIRARAPPITDLSTLGNELNALFQNAQEETSLSEPQITGPTTPSVTEEELARALSKMKKKNTAPGPDVISRQALTLVLPELSHRVRRL